MGVEWLIGLWLLALLLVVLGFGIWRAITAFSGLQAAPHTSYPRTSAQAETVDEAADIRAMVRQLHRLREQEMLNEAEHLRLMTLLDAEHLRVTGRLLLAAGRRVPAEARAPDTRPSATGSPEKPPVGEARLDEVMEAEVWEADVVDEPEPAVPVADLAPAAASVHPLDRPEPAAVPPRPSRSRRALANVLQSFMEERNIRWVELLGGLLIVGCAIGLVISLQATLNRIPYFPALIFMLVTASIHAAGIYTLRRWKLKTTSRGMLIVGMLLIPLNVIAAVALSNRQQPLPASDIRFLLAVVVGVVAFGVMSWFASQALMRRAWFSLMAAVLAPSLGMIIIQRVAHPQLSTARATLLLLFPLAGFLIGTMQRVHHARRWPSLSRRQIERLWLVVGIGAFAFLTALGLLLARAGLAHQVLAQLSPILSLAAASLMACGLVLHRRSTRPQLVLARTSGTALAIGGGLAMLALIGVAFPQPYYLVSIGLLDFVILSAFALMGRVAFLHLPAVSCLALAALVGLPLVQGNVGASEDVTSHELLQVMLLGRSSLLLLGLAGLAFGVARVWQRGEKQDEAEAYRWAALALGGVATLVAVYAGFVVVSDPTLVSLVLSVCATALLLCGALQGKAEMTRAGSGMLLLLIAQVVVMHPGVRDGLGGIQLIVEHPVLVAFMCHSLLSAVVAAAAFVAVRRLGMKERGALQRGFVRPLQLGALSTAAIVAPFAVVLAELSLGQRTLLVWLGGGVVLNGALLLRKATLLAAAQAVFSYALLLLVGLVGQRNGWWNGRLDDYHFASIAIAVLAVWGAGWSGLRIALRQNAAVSHFLRPVAWTVDQTLLMVLVVGLLGLSVYQCWPGAAAELAAAGPAAWQLAAERAAHPAAWCALFAVLLSLVVSLFERPVHLMSAGVVLVLVSAAFFGASLFFEQQAVATALQLAVAGVAFMGVASIAVLQPVARRHSPLSEILHARGRDPYGLSLLMLAVTGGILATIASAAVVQSTSDPVAWRSAAKPPFALAMAISLSGYLVAWLVSAASLRRPPLALAGGVLQLPAVAAVLTCWFIAAGWTVADYPWALLLAAETLATGTYAWSWLALSRWIERPNVWQVVQPRVDAWALPTQLAVALVLLALMAVVAAAALLASPVRPLVPIEQLSRWISYAAWAAVTSASLWYAGRRRVDWCLLILPGSAAALVAIGAATVAQQSVGSWHGYHLLTGGWMLLAGACTAVSLWRRLRSESIQLSRLAGRWVLLFVSANVLVLPVYAGRDTWSWWAGTMLTAGAVLVAVQTIASKRQRLAYFGTFVAAAAATAFWLGYWPAPRAEHLLDLIALNLIGASLAAGTCLIADIAVQRLRDERLFPSARDALVVQHVVLYAVLVAAALVAAGGSGISFLARATGRNEPLDFSSAWFAAAVVVLLLGWLVCLWDRQSRWTIPSLYIAGLVVTVLAMAQAFDVPPAVVVAAGADAPAQYVWVLTALALAGYSTIGGMCVRRAPALAAVGRRLGMPERPDLAEQTLRWLPTVHLLLGTLLVLVQLIAVISFPMRWMRMLAAFTPVVSAAGMASLSATGRLPRWRYPALLFGTIGAVLVAWAEVPPGWTEPLLLDRAIRLLVVLAAFSCLFGAILGRWFGAEHRWHLPLQRMAVTSAVSSMAALLAVLALEWYSFDPVEGAPLDGVQSAAVVVVLVGLIVALLSLALLPARDPLRLSESGRMGYVYAAQGTAALLFAHVYLTNPWIFSGRLRAYWPYIVMAIAFASVAVGELFRRSRVRVLAEPMQRTGGFLPLLPVLAFWILGTTHPLSLPKLGISYAGVLLTVGLLYALLGFLRRSLASGIAAGVAGNAALWAFWSEQQLRLADVPQLWMIPPALSVLIAAHINRDRLSVTQLTAIRYACVLVIYVSSTSQIFLQGLGERLWPPMVLALLSLAGVAMGIVIQVRAFLYLGSTFLLLAIVSMVAHAARSIDHSWPWWAFGIGMGISILVLFGYFEKRRDDVLLLIARLRQWNA